MKRPLRLMPLSIALLTSSLAYAHERPAYNAYFDTFGAPPAARTAKDRPEATRLANGLLGAVTSVDARRGVPTFLWAAKGGQLSQTASAASVLGSSPEQAARFHLEAHKDAYGVTSAALDTANVVHVHDIGRGGIVVTLRQAPNGVELFHSDVKVLMTRGLDLVAISGTPHASGVPGTKGRRWIVSTSEALAKAFEDLYGIAVPSSAMKDTKQAKGGYGYFDLEPTKEVLAEDLDFLEPARVKKVLYPLPDRLVPAYFIEMQSGRTWSTESDAYHYVIAADDGRLLFRKNLTVKDAFSYRVWADPSGDFRPLDGPQEDWTPHPTGTPNGSSPAFIEPNLVSMEGFNKNPNGVADPWLDANATQTRGNNVDAYADHASPNGFSGGDVRASTTAAKTFDRTYNTSLDPEANQNQVMAAVTQLFYVNNWLHDYWYDSGFNEGAGNAQQNNFGRGGVDGDRLLAEAQDYSGKNNANMNPMSDGASPRMQMYLWDGVGTNNLAVSPLNASLATGSAEFGPANFNLPGELVLANDGMNPTADACEPIANNVLGKIVLIERGSCSFTAKAVNAEQKGAIGVIIYNNQPGGGVIGMANTEADGVVSIPSMSISAADGALLKSELQKGPVSVTMVRDSGIGRDGTIDNAIVAHEWGHYIHLRQVACGTTQCGGHSEGWGDFFALHMMLREGDNLDGTFGAAMYSTALLGDSAYFGIRRVPYSVDMNKNALTFKHISNGVALPSNHPMAAAAPQNAEVHNVGEIWATMLFEAYVALLKETQGPNPARKFDEARRAMADYVQVGLQMAPPSPTFTEQRDAILAAAAATNKADFLTIAKAFAKRGAGTCAVSPAADSQSLTGVVEDFEVRPAFSLVSVKVDDSVLSCDSDGILDAEEKGKVTIEVMNTGTAALVGTKGTIATSTPGVTFPGGTSFALSDIEPFTTGKVTLDIDLGAGVTAVQDLALDVTLTNSAACEPTVTEKTQRKANVDNTPSKLDTVESDTPVWVKTGDSAESVWTREEATAPNHVWRGVDYGTNSDTALESPSLNVSATEKFVVSFEHRYQFERSQGINWDGAVLEISADDGQSWDDIGQYVDPGYGGEIGDPQQDAGNPLQGRDGFVDNNPSYPGFDKVKLDLGSKLAGKTVKIRFRIGSDEAQGDEGWTIDNIGFEGIDNAPFGTLTDDVGSCAGAPIADAGPDQLVEIDTGVKLDATKSSDPENDPLTFAWSQTAGPAVKLDDAASATPGFTSPTVTEDTTLTFQVTVSDGKGSASDSVNVVVTPKDLGDNGGGLRLDRTGGCGCSVAGDPTTAALGPLSALALLALRRRRRAAKRSV